MTVEIEPYLAKLESLVDPEHVQRTRDLQRKAFKFEPVEHVPTVINYPLSPEEWPEYTFLEIFDDPAKMLLHELKDVYLGIKLKDDRLYGIRANYGTGIIASLFGCETRIFEDTLPISLALSPDDIDLVIEKGMPDLHNGLVGRAFETAAYFRETLSDFPKLSQAVGSQMLDIQGPFDNASILWGSDIFLAMYDDPQKVERLMGILTETILAVALEHRRIDGCSIEEHDGTWNYLGGLCIRNDSSINLSGDQYCRFVKQFDARLLQEIPGMIHFCGRAHQWWQHLLDLPGLKGINPYQGEFYDLYDMYEKCEAAGVSIFQWTVPLDENCREKIRTGFSRSIQVADYEQALRALELLYVTGHVDG